MVREGFRSILDPLKKMPRYYKKMLGIGISYYCYCVAIGLRVERKVVDTFESGVLLSVLSVHTREQGAATSLT